MSYVRQIFIRKRFIDAKCKYICKNKIMRTGEKTEAMTENITYKKVHM